MLYFSFGTHIIWINLHILCMHLRKIGPGDPEHQWRMCSDVREMCVQCTATKQHLPTFLLFDETQIDKREKKETAFFLCIDLLLSQQCHVSWPGTCGGQWRTGVSFLRGFFSWSSSWFSAQRASSSSSSCFMSDFPSTTSTSWSATQPDNQTAAWIR